jgi:hypothetical protein
MSADIYSIRRRNLRHLADTQCGGRLVDVAHRLSRSPNYISQIAGGYSNIGDAMARHIEQQFGLSQFEFDQPIYEGRAFDSATASIASADPATQRLVWYLLGRDDLSDIKPVRRQAIVAAVASILAWLGAPD